MAYKSILELFNQREILNYLQNRKYPTLVGETLFPEVKKQSLKFDDIRGAMKVPVVASIHAFDTEAEIGSREAEKRTLELALIKRKMQLKEEDIIALENPRNSAEQQYLMREVYNDIDVLVQGVRARVEAMRMEALATGKITIDENGLQGTIDYNVPVENQEVLTGTDLWSHDDSDPIGDILRWVNSMPVKPTRALTSNTVLLRLLTHPKLTALSKTGQIGLITLPELDAIMTSFGLPIIRTYDEVYRKQKPDGTYETVRYFPEKQFVMFGDGPLGQTIYGPTAEEIRLRRDPSIQTNMIGNILAMVYEENLDPVSTWTKAVATAMPSFPTAGEVFQATVI